MSERMIFSRLWDLGEYLCRSSLCYIAMVMLLSILQGKAIPTLPRMTVVGAHPPFLVTTAKTWSFDKLRVS